MPTKNHSHTYIIAIHPVRSARVGSRQLKQPVKPERWRNDNFVDRTISSASLLWQLGTPGVDEANTRRSGWQAEQRKSRQRKRERDRGRKVTALELYNVRATAQERNSILCLPLFVPVTLVVLAIMFFLPLPVKARSTARESIFSIFESLLSGCKTSSQQQAQQRRATIIVVQRRAQMTLTFAWLGWRNNIDFRP